MYVFLITPERTRVILLDESFREIDLHPGGPQSYLPRVLSEDRRSRPSFGFFSSSLPGPERHTMSHTLHLVLLGESQTF